MIIEYTDEDEHSSRLPSVRYQWQVSSDDLMKNSPYFAALLDPNKFFEGRTFMERKAELSRQSELQVRNGDSEPPRDAPRNDLPTVKLNNVDRLRRKHKTDVIGLFLKILSFDSLSDSEKDHFDGEIQRQSPSLIAGLIEIADLFNSPHVVRETLKRSGYAFGRGKVPLTKFNSALLKLSEERVRQIIFIAIFLDEHNIFQILTHTLIVLGSKSWINDVGVPDTGSPSWWYLANGIEGKLGVDIVMFDNRCNVCWIPLTLLLFNQKNYIIDDSAFSTQLQIFRHTFSVSTVRLRTLAIPSRRSQTRLR